MIIKVSTDTWRDVFDFFHLTDRKHLALISELGDRVFSDICQKWLHEWRKLVCLGLINIASPPPVEMMPEVEMPANIRDFKEIRIRYFDVNVLQFLRQLQRLFSGVDMDIFFKTGQLEATQTVLDHLFPLLTGGIETVYLTNSLFLFTLRDRFPSLFLSIKRLDVSSMHPTVVITGEMIALFLSWLGTRRADGQPRMLIFYNSYANGLEFVQRIQQQFLDDMTGTPSNFYIWILDSRQQLEGVQQSTTQNAATSEQLVVKKSGEDALHIGRCSAELDGQKWVEEMHKQRIRAYRQAVQRQITILLPEQPSDSSADKS